MSSTLSDCGASIGLLSKDESRATFSRSIGFSPSRRIESQFTTWRNELQRPALLSLPPPRLPTLQSLATGIVQRQRVDLTSTRESL
ncbi:hypothetical protein RRSWK_07147 [Rhodopirellula sp. SWK7]|nr:hypothetical protein RRSWK_07147 [Rhodopirellula sp. SWK7]